MNKRLLILIMVLAGISVAAQRSEIVIDGVAGEWTSDAIESYDDLEGDGNAVDITELSVTNDEDYLYIKFTLSGDMLLNNNNSLKLHIDSDNNSNTGNTINGIGADFSWHFSERRGYMHDKKDAVYHNQVGFIALPTVSSDTFEIRISRHATPGNTPLFPSETIRISMKDGLTGDVVPDEGDVFSYTFQNLVNDFQPSNLLRAEATDVRVMAYNVLHDGIVKPERKPYFRRIIRATSPDLVVLNECWNTTPQQVVEIFDEFIPLAGGKSWHALKEDGGNVLVSRYPFIDSWRIHPDMRLTAALVDLPDDRFSGDFLAVGAHFRCCDANEARQREADAFVEFILDAKAPGGRITLPENTPFFLAGDLNLVGDAQQLETLLTGEVVNDNFGQGGAPDWDNTSLLDVVSPQTDDPVAATWQSNTSSYWPGRLDFTIVSSSVAQVLNAWVLDTEDMPQERLNSFNLQATDTKEASDHLPKVTDLKLAAPLSTHAEVEKPLRILPNPAKDFILIECSDVEIDSVQFVAVSSGEVISDRKPVSKGENRYRVNISGIPEGIYVIEIVSKTSQKRYYEKVIIMQ